MAKLKKGKLEASTLIEVLIAMVIIMVIFSIAITLFNNVLSGGVSFNKLKVQHELQVLAKKVSDDGYVEQESVLQDSIKYTFFTEASAVNGISKLKVEATQHGKLLGSIKRLYRIKEKHEEN